ncbi:hypothetical protein AGABI2DRAFT_117417 [Agaricus bisporus var. bisporus H97]|uniref:hypothetical protein n=1 Tax=Agaricus bisporus var. bisporus (strain H97 / ATCC MYA-4626 / FGSC 10389) TaxID=936046 RepID=UPI00029F7CE8|nr:hypothetical protein AGABI2DRAFT_117417 [Agaricus bisporus var. bisporus H97]EKV48607.1 hypothetical protein AGABI2DRAFT_117417 [Agaricus bisporus var. bisporus H97]
MPQPPTPVPLLCSWSMASPCLTNLAARVDSWSAVVLWSLNATDKYHDAQCLEVDMSERMTYSNGKPYLHETHATVAYSARVNGGGAVVSWSSNATNYHDAQPHSKAGKLPSIHWVHIFSEGYCFTARSTVVLPVSTLPGASTHKGLRAQPCPLFPSQHSVPASSLLPPPHTRHAPIQSTLDFHLASITYAEDAIDMVGTRMDTCLWFERYRHEWENSLFEWKTIPGAKHIEHKRGVKMYERASGDKTLLSDLQPPDDPRDHDSVFPGIDNTHATVSGFMPDMDTSADLSPSALPFKPWKIYPKPPFLTWHPHSEEALNSSKDELSPPVPPARPSDQAYLPHLQPTRQAGAALAIPPPSPAVGPCPPAQLHRAREAAGAAADFPPTTTSRQCALGSQAPPPTSSSSNELAVFNSAITFDEVENLERRKRE